MLKVALNITDCQGILDPLYQTGFVEKCTAKKRQSGNDLGGRAVNSLKAVLTLPPAVSWDIWKV